MKRIEIKICTGTLCHVMGGADLPDFALELRDKYQEKIHISGSTCMNHCKDSSLTPPFVEIDGHLIQQADREKISTYLESIMES